MTRFRLVLMLLSVLALAVFAGCGSSDDSSDDSSSSTTASTTVSLDDCQAADLDTYKDGVLTIRLPQLEEAKPRQVKVSVGA